VLNYNHVYYFHVTASEGSVARAAARLGVGVPTVSEQIRQLERELGSPLFERLGGKLRLTSAGRNAFEHTSVMFRAGERLVQSLVGEQTPPPLMLRVGISTGVARTVATDFLMPVFAIDECIPTIRSGEAADLLRDLRAHDLDLLVLESDPGQAARPGLELVAIQQVRLVAIIAREVTLSEQWEDAALVHYRPSSIYRFAVDAYLEEQDLRPRIAAETDDAFIMLSAVIRGGFTAFVPWSVARDHVATGKVAVVAEVKPADVAVHALYHKLESAAVARRAVEMLVTCAQEAERG
jgi:LysR family transcriptional regulator, transcriptional activator of nhaA